MFNIYTESVSETHLEFQMEFISPSFFNDFSYEPADKFSCFSFSASLSKTHMEFPGMMCITHLSLLKIEVCVKSTYASFLK